MIAEARAQRAPHGGGEGGGDNSEGGGANMQEAAAATELDFEHAAVVFTSSGRPGLLIYLKNCGVTKQVDRLRIAHKISRSMAEGRGGMLAQETRQEILRYPSLAKFRGGEGGGGASASEGSLYPSATLPSLGAGAVPVVMGEPVGAIVGASKPSLADQL